MRTRSRSMRSCMRYRINQTFLIRYNARMTVPRSQQLLLFFVATAAIMLLGIVSFFRYQRIENEQLSTELDAAIEKQDRILVAKRRELEELKAEVLEKEAN